MQLYKDVYANETVDRATNEMRQLRKLYTTFMYCLHLGSRTVAIVHNKVGGRIERDNHKCTWRLLHRAFNLHYLQYYSSNSGLLCSIRTLLNYKSGKKSWFCSRLHNYMLLLVVRKTERAFSPKDPIAGSLDNIRALANCRIASYKSAILQRDHLVGRKS